MVMVNRIKRGQVRHDALATRARIVAAAERLFAERGVDAVSLNEINRAAGQRNSSALQYHFGGKEGLIHAILEKHTPGIESRRHALLDDIEASGRVELRALAEALVLPVAEKLNDPDGGVAFLRVNAHLNGHPKFPLLIVAAHRVNRGQDRLARLIAKASPKLTKDVLVARWLLITGLLFHGLADYSRLLEREGEDLPIAPEDVFIEHLIDSVVGVITTSDQSSSTE
jgi:AcrR family transcriptional regulator